MEFPPAKRRQAARRFTTPDELPPISCDRPEYAPALISYWAKALAVPIDMVVIHPTLDLRGQPDGGFFVDYECIPWERMIRGKTLPSLALDPLEGLNGDQGVDPSTHIHEEETSYIYPHALWRFIKVSIVRQHSTSPCPLDAQLRYVQWQAHIEHRQSVFSANPPRVLVSTQARLVKGSHGLLGRQACIRDPRTFGT